MKKSHIIAIAVIAVAVAAIMTTVADSSTYASFTTAASHPGKTFHVVGKLDKDKPQVYNPAENANVFTFYLKDNEGVEKCVVLNQAKPQDFDKSEQIVVVGKMKDDQFAASDVLMKCPSKYNNPKDDMNSATSKPL